MYLPFYQLREEPFRLTPDPKFLQLADPHRDALKMLVDGIAERKGLMVLSGPLGTGKTTIVQALLTVLGRTYSAQMLPTALIVNPRLNRDELLETLLLEFDIPGTHGSKAARLAALQGLFFATERTSGTCLLIVDEAHLLPLDSLEEIRLLMNIDSHQQKLLQVVLCGQPELVDLLRQPEVRALQQRVAVRAALRALSSGEMRMYIAERLRIAGLETEIPFTAASMNQIFEYSGGIPRLINILCDTALAIGCATKRLTIGDHVVEEAAARHDLERLDAEPAPSFHGSKLDAKQEVFLNKELIPSQADSRRIT